MAKLRDGNLWLQYNTQQLTETKILSSADKQCQFLNPEGADRDVLLPTASGSGGLEFTIANISTLNNLIAKNDANNIVLTTISPGEAIKFICNDFIWKTLSDIPYEVISPTISGGDATHSPSSAAIYEALLGKSDIEHQHAMTTISGSNLGDFIRWNAENSTWEVASEPLSLKQINLVPSSSATIDEEGGIWYNSVDKRLMLCISEE